MRARGCVVGSLGAGRRRQTGVPRLSRSRGASSPSAKIRAAEHPRRHPPGSPIPAIRPARNPDVTTGSAALPMIVARRAASRSGLCRSRRHWEPAFRPRESGRAQIARDRARALPQAVATSLRSRPLYVRCSQDADKSTERRQNRGARPVRRETANLTVRSCPSMTARRLRGVFLHGGWQQEGLPSVPARVVV